MEIKKDKIFEKTEGQDVDTQATMDESEMKPQISDDSEQPKEDGAYDDSAYETETQSQSETELDSESQPDSEPLTVENDVESEQLDSEQPEVEPERMFTQSQVNQMVGKARKEGRESAMKELLSRYGVDSEDEMNDVFGRGQAYDYLNDEYETQSTSMKDVSAENALLKSRISEDRWDDVKLILNGKGLDVNVENIEMFLPSHPEWRDASATSEVASELPMSEPTSVKQGVEKMVEPKQPAVLRKLGHESKTEPDTESEDEKVKKLFGL